MILLLCFVTTWKKFRGILYIREQNYIYF